MEYSDKINKTIQAIKSFTIRTKSLIRPWNKKYTNTSRKIIILIRALMVSKLFTTSIMAIKVSLTNPFTEFQITMMGFFTQIKKTSHTASTKHYLVSMIKKRISSRKNSRRWNKNPHLTTLRKAKWDLNSHQENYLQKKQSQI